MTFQKKVWLFFFFFCTNRQDTEPWVHDIPISLSLFTFFSQTGKIQSHDVHDIPISDTFFAQTGKIQSHDAHDIPISLTLYMCVCTNRQDTEPWCTWHSSKSDTFYLHKQARYRWFTWHSKKSDTFLPKQARYRRCWCIKESISLGLQPPRCWKPSRSPTSTTMIWGEPDTSHCLVCLKWEQSSFCIMVYGIYFFFKKVLAKVYILSRILGECRVSMTGNYL